MAGGEVRPHLNGVPARVRNSVDGRRCPSGLYSLKGNDWRVRSDAAAAARMGDQVRLEGREPLCILEEDVPGAVVAGPIWEEASGLGVPKRPPPALLLGTCGHDQEAV